MTAFAMAQPQPRSPQRRSPTGGYQRVPGHSGAGLMPGQTAAALGRGGDTLLAHVTPEEAQLLERRGGAGTRNPFTGLPEFYDPNDPNAGGETEAGTGNVSDPTGGAGGGPAGGGMGHGPGPGGMGPPSISEQGGGAASVGGVGAGGVGMPGTSAFGRASSADRAGRASTTAEAIGQEAAHQELQEKTARAMAAQQPGILGRALAGITSLTSPALSEQEERDKAFSEAAFTEPARRDVEAGLGSRPDITGAGAFGPTPGEVNRGLGKGATFGIGMANMLGFPVGFTATPEIDPETGKSIDVVGRMNPAGFATSMMGMPGMHALSMKAAPDVEIGRGFESAGSSMAGDDPEGGNVSKMAESLLNTVIGEPETEPAPAGRSVVPYRGNYATYGQRPEHRFFKTG